MKRRNFFSSIGKGVLGLGIFKIMPKGVGKIEPKEVENLPDPNIRSTDKVAIKATWNDGSVTNHEVDLDKPGHYFIVGNYQRPAKLGRAE